MLEYMRGGNVKVVKPARSGLQTEGTESVAIDEKQNTENSGSLGSLYTYRTASAGRGLPTLMAICLGYHRGMFNHRGHGRPLRGKQTS